MAPTFKSTHYCTKVQNMQPNVHNQKLVVKTACLTYINVPTNQAYLGYSNNSE